MYGVKNDMVQIRVVPDLSECGNCSEICIRALGEVTLFKMSVSDRGSDEHSIK